MDTTLVNFNDRTWERGDVSFIYKAEAKPGDCLVILDNKAKVFQRVRYEVRPVKFFTRVYIFDTFNSTWGCFLCRNLKRKSMTKSIF